MVKTLPTAIDRFMTMAEQAPKGDYSVYSALAIKLNMIPMEYPEREAALHRLIDILEV